MTRPARVVGGVVALSVLLCVVVWAFAFRTPSVDRQPLPNGIISLDSAAGAQLLAGSRFNADYDGLSRFFESQSRAAYCGVASSVVVLNALHARPLLTQATFFDDATVRVRGPLRVTLGGMTLAQLGQLLRAHRVRATVTYASDVDVSAFRAIVRQNLQTADDYVLVNYERAVLGQGASGHISPLAAYDAQTDRTLILDVAAYRYPPVWVALQDLWNAMNTIDGTSGRTRGFVAVRGTKGEAE